MSYDQRPVGHGFGLSTLRAWGRAWSGPGQAVNQESNIVRSRPFKSLLLIAAMLGAPAASLADTGPCATNTGGALPDLIVNATKLAQYLSVAEEKYVQASCAVQEGYVAGPGWRTLLRFTTSTANIGTGALVIGNPASCPAVFVASSCHGHLHFHQYADYRLWTPGGYQTWVALRDLSLPANLGSNAAALLQAFKNKSLLVGRKMGFCMIDSEPHLAGAGAAPTFISCQSNQGISAGWTDTYNAYLDGQYVEMDALKSGDYVLEVHVNPDQALPESVYANNSSALKIRYLARHGTVPASVQVIN